MITLENVLANLTDYVDLGTKLLESKSITCFEDAVRTFSEDEDIPRTITDLFDIDALLDEYDLSDIGWYLNRKYSCSDVFDACDYSDSDVSEYVANSDLGNNILNSMSKSDLRDFLRDNFDWDDFIDVDWRCY